MTKQEFIEFIEELGFKSSPIFGDSFSMVTDSNLSLNQVNQPFASQLNIRIKINEDMIQLSLSEFGSHLVSGKSFGNFSLKTFGDDGDIQLELFLSFILGSFEQKPAHIIQWMRDKKIKNILR
jgi:hypothetical protein